MTGPRPFTRAQTLQNAAFLAALRRTGNARLAAAELGVHRATYTKRRAKSAAFAQEWDAALAFAHAALSNPRSSRAQSRDRAPRTLGGEPRLVRSTRNGRLQLRRSPPGRMTKSAEQSFLAALSATANIRLSAAAAGFTHATFYRRARASPAFAREMRAALRIGYDRLECALIERAIYDERDLADDEADWRDHIGDNPLPPLAPLEAIHLLALHRRTCRLGWHQRDARFEVATNAEVRHALADRIREMGWRPEERQEEKREE